MTHFNQEYTDSIKNDDWVKETIYTKESYLKWIISYKFRINAMAIELRTLKTTINENFKSGKYAGDLQNDLNSLSVTVHGLLMKRASLKHLVREKLNAR